MHHLVGDYESVLAVTQTMYSERPSAENPEVRVPVDAEDCVMMLARMKSGGLGHLEATKIATGTEDELRFEIHGTQGAIRFNTMAPHFLEVFDLRAATVPIGGTQGWTRIATGQRYPGTAAPVPSPKNSMGWIRSHAACLANFLEAVAAGAPGNPGLDQGIYIQRLIECTRQSAACGEWTTI
jgi:predicted dehydrogenase